MLSDEWLPRYRLLENFTAKWNGNGNAYDRGDYNSSFALRAVELKTVTNCYIGRVGGEGICIKEGAMTWIVCLATTQQVGVIAFAPQKKDGTVPSL